MEFYEVVENIMNHKPVTAEELNIFLITYIEKESGKTPTSEQLRLISKAVKSGMFDMSYMLDIIADNCADYNIEVTTLYNRDGGIVRTFIHEKRND